VHVCELVARPLTVPLGGRAAGDFLWSIPPKVDLFSHAPVATQDFQSHDGDYEGTLLRRGRLNRDPRPAYRGCDSDSASAPGIYKVTDLPPTC
jgi:hypothetical protein